MTHVLSHKVMTATCRAVLLSRVLRRGVGARNSRDFGQVDSACGKSLPQSMFPRR